MARRRYADALQIFRSLPSYRLDQSLAVMARYAANMTGQRFESDTDARTAEIESLSSRLSRLENLLSALLSSADATAEASPTTGTGA